MTHCESQKWYSFWFIWDLRAGPRQSLSSLLIAQLPKTTALFSFFFFLIKWSVNQQIIIYDYSQIHVKIYYNSIFNRNHTIQKHCFYTLRCWVFWHFSIPDVWGIWISRKPVSYWKCFIRWDFPGSPVKTPSFQCRGHKFNPWLEN